MSEPKSQGSGAKIGTYIVAIAGIVVLVVMAIIWIRHMQLMGTRLEFSKNEAINYSGSATEADARALGQALQRIGYFSGSNEIDVLLKKSDNGTVLSFVVSEEGYTDPEFEAQFKFISESVAYAVGGPPFKVRLLDTNLSTQKEFTIASSRWGTPESITAKETIYRLGDTTVEEARALGKALQEDGYFDDSRPKDVFLHKEGGMTTLSFATAPAGWTEENFKADFRAMTQKLAPVIGGKPLTFRLLDDYLEVKLEEKIE